jgi:glycosyltransferase involved in cell wall biosynthesis
MVKFMPKVSVVIPTYQSAKYIQEAIDSILNQAYKDYEIIVVDDGSTDDTIQVLKKYGTRIKVIRQENRGAANARNRGILASCGEYIAFLDSDDVWMPNKLELHINILENNPEIGIVFSDVICVFGDRKTKYFNFRNPHSGEVYIHLFIRNFIPMSAAVVRKKCFEEVGLFDESLSASEDHDMWLRIARFFKVDFIDEPLAHAHISVVREQRMSSYEIVLQESNIELRKKALKQNPELYKSLSLDALNRIFYSLYKRLGILYIVKGRIKNARENFKDCITSFPHPWKVYLLMLFTYLHPKLIQGTWRFLKTLSKTKLFSRTRYYAYGKIFDYNPHWCEFSDIYKKE